MESLPLCSRRVSKSSSLSDLLKFEGSKEGLAEEVVVTHIAGGCGGENADTRRLAVLLVGVEDALDAARDLLDGEGSPMEDKVCGDDGEASRGDGR